MKRRILTLLGAVALLLTLVGLPAARAEAGNYNLVLDEAGLMPVEMSAALDAKAWQVSNANNLEACILVVNGTGGKPLKYYAADYWDENGYGRGPNHDGVMLALDLAERDWFILTTGDGIRIFTDYGIRVIGNEIVPYLSSGKYYEAFDRYLDLAGEFAAEANTNQPYDTNHEYQGKPKTLAEKLGMAAPVGLVASLLTTLFGMGGMKRGMHTVHRKHGATQYARRDSMQMTRTADLFLYHTQHRERLPDPPKVSGGGGGSTTFTSSSGVTHGGGGGKF